MIVTIPELETAGERWVRLRDEYLDELEHCNNAERRDELKCLLRQEFNKWLETL